jgi:hypothetical protein
MKMVLLTPSQLSSIRQVLTKSFHLGLAPLHKRGASRSSQLFLGCLEDACRSLSISCDREHGGNRDGDNVPQILFWFVANAALVHAYATPTAAATQHLAAADGVGPFGTVVTTASDANAGNGSGTTWRRRVGRIARRHLHSQMIEIEWAAAHRHWHDNPPVLEQRGHTLPGCLRTGLLLASELCPLGFPGAFGRIAIE